MFVRHSVYMCAFDCLQSQTRQDQAEETTGMTVHAILASMISNSFDPWVDADMASVVQYLRANKRLHVPQDLREILGMNK